MSLIDRRAVSVERMLTLDELGLNAASGTWELDAFHGDGEGVLTSDARLARSWTRSPAEDLPPLSPASGLTLHISDDGHLDEEAASGADEQVDIFASDGVLGTTADAFPGRVLCEGGRLFVLSDDEEPCGMRRLSDGDTEILDELRPAGDQLLRIVSVVTDDSTLHRFVYRYSRAD